MFPMNERDSSESEDDQRCDVHDRTQGTMLEVAGNNKRTPSYQRLEKRSRGDESAEGSIPHGRTCPKSAVWPGALASIRIPRVLDISVVKLKAHTGSGLPANIFEFHGLRPLAEQGDTREQSGLGII